MASFKVENTKPKKIHFINNSIDTYIKKFNVNYNGTITTVWSAGNTVTYIVDTGVKYTEEVDADATCLSPKTFTPTKDGWTFVGWRKDKTASSSTETSVIMDSDPITLYAVFKKTLTLTYYDGSATAQTKTGTRYYNAAGNYKDPSITMTQTTSSGWTCRGWSTTNAGNATVNYANGASITFSSNLTIYGLYQKTITVSYYQISDTSKKTATGTMYWAPAGNVYPKITINPTGFGTEWTWRGWTTTANDPDAGVTYSSISNTEFSSDITLYPLIYMYVTLSYSGNGATSGSTAAQGGYRYLTTSSSGNTDQPAYFSLAANGFTRTNYTFTGWNLGAVGATVAIYSNTTATAQWKVAFTSKEFNYTGGTQAFTVPVTGTYKLQVWGAQGGTGYGNGYSVAGGLGGYSYGNVSLSAGQTIYVVVGGQGGGMGSQYGGYNGGGNGGYPGNGTIVQSAGGGGGATHIGTFNSVLSSRGSTSGLYIVAGGGGGGTGVLDGGYHVTNAGGTGGGTSGGAGTSAAGGGTQSSGGARGWEMVWETDADGDEYCWERYAYPGSFGKGGAGVEAWGAGGGGGLYGGGGSANGSGGGGSGYIGGVSSGSTANGQRSGHGYAIISYVG